MGVASGCGEQDVYIYIYILVSVLFCCSIPNFLSFFI